VTPPRRARQLSLLRHAKSSWDDGGLDDHDRPLAPRGEKAIRRLAKHVAGAGVAPDLVLCSSARRTVMTLEGIRPELPADTEVRVERGLYAASSSALLARLRRVDDSVDSVLLIAHNPGIEMLAATLIGAGDDRLRERLAEKFPTGALADLHFEGPWAKLAAGAATLESFVVPRDLS
jgi:phosphohistidine phosphatase